VEQEEPLGQETEGEVGKEPSPVDPRGQEGWRGHWRGPG
jgi:hypothetical protein